MQQGKSREELIREAHENNYSGKIWTRSGFVDDIGYLLSVIDQLRDSISRVYLRKEG